LLALALGLPIPASAGSPTIAVTYFDNNTGDPANDALGRGLADMLITDLAQLSTLRLVERARLNEVLAELELADSAFVDPATAATMGRGLGASLIVTGSFVAIHPQMRIDARVVDVATGEVLASTEVTGPTDEFFLLEKELAMAIAEQAGVEVSFREQARLGQVATESFGAFSAWSEGLEALDRGALEEARAELEASLQHDERFAPASQLLVDLQLRLVEYGEQRGELLAARTVEVLARLDAIAAAGGPYDEVPAVVDVIALSSDVQATRDGNAIARRILDMELPETVQMELLPGKRLVMNEWALWWTAHTSMMLGQRAEALTYGEALLQRYPTSMYASGVNTMMQTLTQALQQQEQGRAEVPAIRSAAARLGQELRCRREPRPEARREACLGWLRLGEGLEEQERSQVIRTAAMRLRESADGAGLDQALALVVDDEKLIDAREDVRRWQTDAEGAAARAADAGDARGARDAIDDLIGAGRRDEAHAALDEALRRWSDDPDLRASAVSLAVSTGDLEAAESAQSAWSERWAAHEAADEEGDAAEALARYRDAAASDRVTRSVDSLRDHLAELADVEPEVLYRLARDLQNAHQYAEAAVEWERLGRDFPGFRSHDASQSLWYAAAAWHSAGDVQRARGLYVEVAERYGDTPSGESARIMVQTLPR